MKANRLQVRAINAILAKKGILEDKAALIGSFTEGRTEHSSELTTLEANGLIEMLKKDFIPSMEDLRKERMQRKVLAMAHELGWIKRSKVIIDGKMATKADYTAINNWMVTYSYLKKPLREYSYEELPKLITQFEKGPYAHYISKH